MHGKTAAITEGNTWTEWTSPRPEYKIGARGAGSLNVSIWGTWTGKVTLQRTFDDGETTLEVMTTRKNLEDYLFDYSIDVKYRIGMATGDHTSGTCNVRVGY